jgi:hypothetical protein
MEDPRTDELCFLFEERVPAVSARLMRHEGIQSDVMAIKVRPQGVGRGEVTKGEIR